MGRKNRQRKPEPFKCCETCANMQPIGEISDCHEDKKRYDNSIKTR